MLGHAIFILLGQKHVTEALGVEGLHTANVILKSMQGAFHGSLIFMK